MSVVIDKASIVLANPRGFCAGVDRAIDVVERALALFKAPIYVRHEIVHNRYVVEDLKAKGVVFVSELHEVPDGSVVIFSAHGVAKSVVQEGESRDLTVFDATCPLVTKVHMEVARCAKHDEECILIGHAGHPEVIGTMGQYHNENAGIYLVENIEDAMSIQVKNPEQLAFVTQTTLSVDETLAIIAILQSRFPKIKAPKRDDICYATQNRQDAVRMLSEQVDVILVVGSPNSSNSSRLRELAERMGTPAYLLDDPAQLQAQWVAHASSIGVTAGASAPEVLVQSIIKVLQSWGAGEVQHLQGAIEDVTFALPKALRDIPVVVKSPQSLNKPAPN
jgi:4-hydroxy-3-methylbut-2-en-1-yl diphosphate reductase